MRLARYLLATATTQAAFAEKIGVTQACVNRYIESKRFPDPKTIAKIAAVTAGFVTVSDWHEQAAAASELVSSGEKRIYFVRPVGQDGPIKIGCSRWPDNRLLEIAKWSPVPLELIAAAPGDHTLERRLHRKFSKQRSHKEWFLASADLVDGIELVRAGASIEKAFRVSRLESGRAA